MCVAKKKCVYIKDNDLKIEPVLHNSASFKA